MIGFKSFVLNEINEFSVKILNKSSLVYIKRNDFFQCLKNFPDDYQKFCYFRD